MKVVVEGHGWNIVSFVCDMEIHCAKFKYNSHFPSIFLICKQNKAFFN
jgi:hypothetical protein